MILIDARGIDCPKPVIMTKNALDEIEEGIVHIIADNKACVMNMKKFAEGQNYEINVKDRDDGNWDLYVTKELGTKVEDSIDELEEDDSSLVIVISSNKMGEDPELGKILIRSFLYTVTETKPLPQAIIFYNTGVYLTLKDSEVLDSLEELEEMGVEITSCGTCLDYFEVIDDLGVGSVSNMYDIYEKMKNPIRTLVI